MSEEAREIGRRLLEDCRRRAQEVLKTHPYCVEVTERHLPKIKRRCPGARFIYKGEVLVGRKWIKLYYACFATKEEAERANSSPSFLQR